MQGFSLPDAHPRLFHLTTATAQLADPNAAWSRPCQPDHYHLTRAFPMRHDDNRVANQRARITCPQAETEPGEPRVFYLMARSRAIFQGSAAPDMPAECESTWPIRTVPECPARQGALWHQTAAARKPNSKNARSDGSDSGDGSRNACCRTPRISGRPRRTRDQPKSPAVGAPLHPLVRQQPGRNGFPHATGIARIARVFAS